MYVEKDWLGKPLPPAVLVANTLIAVGDTAYHAVGDVVLTRTDLVARGDSAFVQSTRHYARLLRRPVIESKGDQPFTLRGRVIDLYGAAKELDRVVALDSAKAVSKDLTVVSDTIDLRVARNHLERAFAFGRSGATATTAERTVIADSLDILMPGQRVRELHAIGRAYIESDPDTTRVKSDERDWLKGDTIIAHFDSLASNDTTSRARLESVLATGNASSLYQVPPNRQTSPRPSSVSEKPSTAAPKQQPPAGKAAEPKPTLANKPAIPDTRERPGINYVRGRVIHLQFIKGEVDSVTVVDNASGLYLEPESDSAAAARRRTMKPATPRSPVTPPIRRPPTRSP
jgi:hypothetical protein